MIRVVSCGVTKYGGRRRHATTSIVSGLRRASECQNLLLFQNATRHSKQGTACRRRSYYDQSPPSPVAAAAAASLLAPPLSSTMSRPFSTQRSNNASVKNSNYVSSSDNNDQTKDATQKKKTLITPKLQQLFTTTHEEKQMLEYVVTEAVRKYLSKHYKDVFSWHTSLWENLFITSSNTTSSGSNYKTKKSLEMLDTLAAMNGFERIDTKKFLQPDSFVSLAEGVIAKPDLRQHISKQRRRKLSAILSTIRGTTNSDDNDHDNGISNDPLILWSRPIASVDSNSSGNALSVMSSSSSSPSSNILGTDGGKNDRKRYPNMVQQDTTLYRLVENHIEQYIQNKYKSIRMWYSKSRIAVALEYLGIGVSASEVPSTTSTALEASKTNRNEAESFDKQRIYKNDIQISEPNEDAEAEEEDAEEQLLLMDMNSMSLEWFTHISPKHRLLACNHTYHHKFASSVIHVSLVVFGAIPLAYRSFIFVWDYPGLSEIVATSVISTVVYGIWSSRSITANRQQQIVTTGISKRIIARDHIIIYTLQQNSIQLLTNNMLELYYLHYYPDYSTTKGSNHHNNVADVAAAMKTDDTSSKIGGFFLDPLDVAIELGLINKKVTSKDDAVGTSTSKNNNTNNTEYVSAPLQDVLSRLQK